MGSLIGKSSDSTLVPLLTWGIVSFRALRSVRQSQSVRSLPSEKVTHSKHPRTFLLFFHESTRFPSIELINGKPKSVLYPGCSGIALFPVEIPTANRAAISLNRFSASARMTSGRRVLFSAHSETRLMATDAFQPAGNITF